MDPHRLENKQEGRGLHSKDTLTLPKEGLRPSHDKHKRPERFRQEAKTIILSSCRLLEWQLPFMSKTVPSSRLLYP